MTGARHGATEVDVAVVGGAIAGAATGCAFAGSGLNVRIFERRDLQRDPNRGDILHPPTVDICKRWGAFDRFVQRGATEFSQLHIVTHDHTLHYVSPTQTLSVLNHAELEHGLLDTAIAGGVAVDFNAVRSLTKAGDRWLLTTDEGVTSARFIVGADGKDSLVRRTLGIEIGDRYDYDEAIVVLHADRPSWLEPEEGLQLLSPAGGVFVLPTTPAGRVRLVVFVPDEETAHWATASETVLAERLGQRYDKLAGLRVTKRGGSHIYKLARTHADAYGGQDAALVGDSAHTINPMGGQGLNLAIQDASALAEAVVPHLLDGTDTSAGVEAYEARRRPINHGTLEWAHTSAAYARPGLQHYAAAVAFYEQLDQDPEHVLRFTQRFGGRE